MSPQEFEEAAVSYHKIEAVVLAYVKRRGQLDPWFWPLIDYWTLHADDNGVHIHSNGVAHFVSMESLLDPTMSSLRGYLLQRLDNDWSATAVHVAHFQMGLKALKLDEEDRS